jgi:hypothetical protein
MKRGSVVIVLGLSLSIPLACGGGSDGSGAGTGGSASGGKAGKGGSAGSGHGAQGGTGANGGGVGVGTSGEAGLEAGGATSEAAALEREAHCESICAKKVNTSGEAGAGGAAVATSCGGELSCSAYLCDTTGLDQACLDNLDRFVACLDAGDPSNFYCGPVALAWDKAGYYLCMSELYTWLSCHRS